MTSSILSTASIPRRTLRGLVAAAVCVVGFGVMGADSAQAEQRWGHGRGGAGCVAHATTFRGAVIPGTKARAERHNPRGACAIALNKCQTKLDRKRHRSGRPMPFARCEVVRTAHRGDRFEPRTRCVAEASRRNGRALPATRAAEVRRNRRQACAVAIAECDRKLDRLRWSQGRPMPHARCGVIGTSRVSSNHLASPVFSLLATFGK